jgi:hypothetical protein
VAAIIVASSSWVAKREGPTLTTKAPPVNGARRRSTMGEIALPGHGWPGRETPTMTPR